MTDFVEIGTVVRAQLQTRPLKVGQGSARYYDPSPVVPVERLLVGPDGVRSVGPGGELLLDVHHVRHPQSRNRAGRNGLSLMFTSHYELLGDFFGGEIAEGCGGENLLIQTKSTFDLRDLRPGLLIRPAQGSAEIVLDVLDVIEPCTEFSSYLCEAGGAPGGPRPRDALQFLRDGRRGFLARLAAGDHEVEISSGARVYLLRSSGQDPDASGGAGGK